MDKSEFEDEIELLKFIFLNLITIVGLVVIVVGIFLILTNIDQISIFIYSLGFTIFIFGVSMGYNTKSRKDQKIFKNEISDSFKKIDENLEKIINKSDGIVQTDDIVRSIIDKNDELNLTEQEKIENLRKELQISYERSNQLTALNHQSTGITAAIFIGSITFLGSAYFTSVSPERYLAVPIMMNILILTLLLWRFYSHVIDNDISQSYKKILYCEYKLKIPEEISLLKSIEERLPILNKTEYIRQSADNKYKITEVLINSKRIGYRYHDGLDILSMGIIAFSIIVEIYFIPINATQFNTLFIFSFLVVLPIFYLILCFSFVLDIFPRIPIQRDPSCEDIQKIINQIKDLK